ncbi:MAG: DUF3276 family protein [Ignavibacteriales bacterium]|nr:DUF3276 family protein [Ignavibacteriales bacterium]
MSDQDAIYSTSIRAGKTTYFVDVKEAKNGNKYLAISENRIDGEKRQRTTLRIFEETVAEFQKVIDEAAAAISQT